MNEEVSHVAQWLELSQRARRFGLATTLESSDGFGLMKGFAHIGGMYATLADLRAAISDYVAKERQAGRMRF